MRSPVAADQPISAVSVAADAGGVELSAFHVASLAFQRARQLRSGCRPRLEAGSHKYLWVAMHEVRAGMVTWDVAGEPERAV